MPFDGAGTFSPAAADFPVVTATTISSTKFNNTVNDLSTGLSNAVTRDGQSPWSANLPAGGFKLTGLGAGTMDGESVRYEQMNAAIAAVFTTGDVKLTLKTTADAGWVLMNDTTIGNAASGATGRAHADTAALFALLWNNTLDADCAVSTGRGASAAADYAANKTIALPKALGRALAQYGTGAGLSARALAAAVGTEDHTITTANLPASGLTIPALTIPPLGAGTLAAAAVTGSLSSTQGATGQGYTTPGTNTQGNTTLAITGSTAGGVTSADTTGNMGTGADDVPLVQPTLFLNTMIKL